MIAIIVPLGANQTLRPPCKKRPPSSPARGLVSHFFLISFDDIRGQHEWSSYQEDCTSGIALNDGIQVSMMSSHASELASNRDISSKGHWAS